MLFSEMCVADLRDGYLRKSCCRKSKNGEAENKASQLGGSVECSSLHEQSRGRKLCSGCSASVDNSGGSNWRDAKRRAPCKIDVSVADLFAAVESDFAAPAEAVELGLAAHSGRLPAAPASFAESQPVFAAARA
jgi:hypothetical protein